MDHSQHEGHDMGAPAPADAMAGQSTGHAMQMSFYWGPNATFLFSAWTTTTWGWYMLALLVCLIATVAFEALFALRALLAARMRHRYTKRMLAKAALAIDAKGASPGDGTPPEEAQQVKRVSSWPPVRDGETAVPMSGMARDSTTMCAPHLSLGDRALMSLLLAGTAAFSYLLMLLIMTYNGGVFLALVLGHFVGVFFFGTRRILHEDETTEVAAGCHDY